jgi:hypothetical protein
VACAELQPTIECRGCKPHQTLLGVGSLHADLSFLSRITVEEHLLKLDHHDSSDNDLLHV